MQNYRNKTGMVMVRKLDLWLSHVFPCFPYVFISGFPCFFLRLFMMFQCLFHGFKFTTIFFFSMVFHGFSRFFPLVYQPVRAFSFTYLLTSSGTATVASASTSWSPGSFPPKTVVRLPKCSTRSHGEHQWAPNSPGNHGDSIGIDVTWCNLM